MPMFNEGDRVFSHYTMKWGTIVSVGSDEPVHREGVEVPGKTDAWHDVRWDDGTTDYMNDGGGDWDSARVLPPAIAKRYGYGEDPRA